MKKEVLYVSQKRHRQEEYVPEESQTGRICVRRDTDRKNMCQKRHRQ